MSATCERCGRLECEANGRHRFDYMIIDCLEEQVDIALGFLPRR